MIITRDGAVWHVNADGSQTQATPAQCAGEIERLTLEIERLRQDSVKMRGAIYRASEELRRHLGISPPLVHIGPDGYAHPGPRSECSHLCCVGRRNDEPSEVTVWRMRSEEWPDRQ
jgi:hypothetical protein